MDNLNNFPLRVCQTCHHCSPKAPKLGLFCGAPALGYEKKPQPIFWAILKGCGEERNYWEGEK